MLLSPPAEVVSSAEESALAVELWRAEPASVRYVGHSENRVCGFTRAGQQYFLRCVSPERRALDQIKAELDFILHLHRGGVSVSLPLTSAHSRLVESIRRDRQTLFACAFAEAKGEPFAFGLHAANVKHFFLRGRTLGRIHALAKTYAPAGDLRRFSWDEDALLRDIEDYLPATEEAVWMEYRRLMDWLRGLPRESSSFGLIHGDFGATNFRCRADRLTVFDFDDCCHHWFAYDLAITIYPHGWREKATALLAALLEGYTQETGCAVLRADLLNFCRLRQLYLFLSHAKKWGLSNLSDERARWFARVRQNIARGYVLRD